MHLGTFGLRLEAPAADAFLHLFCSAISFCSGSSGMQTVCDAWLQVQAAVADSQAGRPRRTSSGAVGILRGGSGLLGLGRR